MYVRFVTERKNLYSLVFKKTDTHEYGCVTENECV